MLKIEDLKLNIKNLNMMVAALEEDNAVSALKEDNAAAVTLMEDSNTSFFVRRCGLHSIPLYVDGVI